MVKTILLTILLLALILAAVFFCDPQPEVSQPEPESISQPEEQKPVESSALFEPQYPAGSFIITKDREAYQNGDMILEIPRLDLRVSVINGTDEEALKRGVGLFEYSQLPGTFNSNVSIAGHRDIYGQEFYYIDTIIEGDLLYLYYGDKMYTYTYAETFITDDSNWDPIRVHEDARITLQSCDPIGTSLHRIFVVGILVNVTEYVK